MKCTYTKPDGKACRSNAMKDSSFCWRHSPEISELEKKYVSSRGGKKSKSLIPLDLPDLAVKNSLDIPPLLVNTIAHIRKGAIDVRVGNAIGYLSNVLLKAYELADLEVRMEKIEQYIKENFGDESSFNE